MFARKPAPVQVTWLAYPGTTGLSTIDFRLTDPYLDPAGLFEEFYSEESLRLPDTFWCYDPLTDELAVNALPASTNGVITFGCLNNFCKVNDQCLQLWSGVLGAVPQSRLLLVAPRDPARDRLLARLEEQGIAASRVEFAADRLPRLEYFRLYSRVDVALDPLPCNGATTTLDAFWMGVPTLSQIGNTVVGRAGWSLLCNLGLKELAAETPEEFVELAVRLTADLPRLEELRGSLRLRMQKSPLMDGRRFARHVEAAYRQMWQRWCQETREAKKRSPVSPAPPSRGQGAEIDGSPARQSLVTASQHYQQGEWQQAEQLCRQVLEADQEHGRCAASAGDDRRPDGPGRRGCSATSGPFVRLRPVSADAHNNLGNLLMLANASREPAMLDEAIEHYRQALRLRPQFAEGYNNLGNVLLEQGPDRPLRKRLFGRRSLLKPNYADAHYNLGVALWKQDRLDEAIASHRQALHLNPDHV